MSKYQEVEAKFELNNYNEVVKKIEQLSLLKIVDNEKQIDTYYTPCHRNFLDFKIVSEWFRVRETSKKSSVNFKQFLPIGAEIQDQCNEYETVISDIIAFKNILALLDFRELIKVDKIRNSWLFNKVEISIDYVDDLGYFIEIEAKEKVEESEIHNMHEYFKEVLSIINADTGERNRRGYPYMLIEKKFGV